MAGGRVPRELANLVRARTRGAQLAPVATVSTRRQAISLLDSAGQLLAEVADDRVTASRPQDLAPADTWREVEVELAGGEGDLLVAADEVLRGSGVTQSARSAKLERVLSSQLPPAPDVHRPTATGPAREAIASYLAEQAEELAALDPLVRRLRPDSVHKMRIATRRLRSTCCGLSVRSSSLQAPSTSPRSFNGWAAYSAGRATPRCSPRTCTSISRRIRT